MHGRVDDIISGNAVHFRSEFMNGACFAVTTIWMEHEVVLQMGGVSLISRLVRDFQGQWQLDDNATQLT